MEDLLPRQTLSGLVEQHDTVIALMTQGLECLSKAQEIMKGALGESAPLFPNRSFNTWGIDAPDCRERLIQDSQAYIRGSFWGYTQRQAGIRDLMSKEDRAAVDSQIKSQATPPFTLPNLITTLQGLAQDVEEIFLRAVRACFDHYRPCSHSRRHVTNKTDRIGPKIIRTCCVGCFSINTYSEDYLADLCRVFHGLDGKTAAQRGNPAHLVTAINTALRGKLRECQTPYFICKWYKNGNLHITFTRPDLLSRFNHIGAGGRVDLGGGRKAKGV